MINCELTHSDHPILKTTEIQLDPSSGNEYFEIYNIGHDVDLSTLSFSGIVTGTSSSSSTLSQGSYVVIESDHSGLSWIGGSMTSFSLSISYTNPSDASLTVIESLVYGNDLYWPTVSSNYPLELLHRGYNNQFGSSWVMGCSTSGSAGAAYDASECAYDCTVDGVADCDLNGGHNPNATVNNGPLGCDPSTGSCHCKTGFYAYYESCYPLPPPDGCVATYITASRSSAEFNVSRWDGDTKYTYYHCEIPGGCTGGIVEVIYIITYDVDVVRLYF